MFARYPHNTYLRQNHLQHVNKNIYFMEETLIVHTKPSMLLDIPMTLRTLSYVAACYDLKAAGWGTKHPGLPRCSLSRQLDNLADTSANATGTHLCFCCRAFTHQTVSQTMRRRLVRGHCTCKTHGKGPCHVCRRPDEHAQGKEAVFFF